jgi:hypothetical protein
MSVRDVPLTVKRYSLILKLASLDSFGIFLKDLAPSKLSPTLNLAVN